MDVMTMLKNIGGALATVTTVVYVSGYLSLRARAFTLGTDPHFSLAYEGYVFAGFRFLYVSLIILLIVSPAILAARFGAGWLKQRLSVPQLDAGQWLLLVLLSACTLVITYKVLSVQDVLLQEKGSPRVLCSRRPSWAGARECFSCWPCSFWPRFPFSG